jgi:hypothetical protein
MTDQRTANPGLKRNDLLVPPKTGGMARRGRRDDGSPIVRNSLKVPPADGGEARPERRQHGA